MTYANLPGLSLGFEAVGICLFIWASIDPNRFIKFWMRKPAPYSKLVQILFRSVFLLCVLGGVLEFASHLHDVRPAAELYVHTILTFAISLAVIFALVHIVEWTSSKIATRREP